MQILLWGSLIIVFGIAIFAIQNSGTPPVVVRYLFWRFETSLIFTILGSFLAGVLASFLFSIFRAARASLSKIR